MRPIVFALVMALAAGNVLAQHRDGGGRGKGPGKAAPPPQGRIIDQRIDQRGPPRPERMSPADRERLRRDIEDANRGMPQRR
jgi:hypothetical protein